MRHGRWVARFCGKSAQSSRGRKVELILFLAAALPAFWRTRHPCAATSESADLALVPECRPFVRIGRGLAGMIVLGLVAWDSRKLSPVPRKSQAAGITWCSQIASPEIGCNRQVDLAVRARAYPLAAAAASPTGAARKLYRFIAEGSAA